MRKRIPRTDKEKLKQKRHFPTPQSSSFSTLFGQFVVLVFSKATRKCIPIPDYTANY